MLSRVVVIENGPGLALPFRKWLKNAGATVEVWRSWLPGWSPDVSLGRLEPVGRDSLSFVLTGDLHNLTDGLLPRHERQLEVLDRAAGCRVFASCFSHQLIAHARGGRVERRSSRLLGWKSVSVEADAGPLSGIDRFDSIYLNIDEIVEAPPGATLIGASPDCRFSLLTYDDNVITCQSHPELTSGTGLDVAVLLGLMVGGPRGANRLRKDAPGDTTPATRLMNALASWLAGA